MMWSDTELTTLEEKYETVPTNVISEQIDRTSSAINSKAHQLGLTKDRAASRTYHIGEKSVNVPTDDEEFAHYICGFVDGEGSFNSSAEGGNFRFAIELADDDKDILVEIQEYLGVGSVYDAESKKDDWSNKSQYVVYDAESLALTIIPFFDEYKLRAPRKQTQFERFKQEFYDYYNLTPKGLSR